MKTVPIVFCLIRNYMIILTAIIIKIVMFKCYFYRAHSTFINKNSVNIKLREPTDYDNDAK